MTRDEIIFFCIIILLIFFINDFIGLFVFFVGGGGWEVMTFFENNNNRQQRQKRNCGKCPKEIARKHIATLVACFVNYRQFEWTTWFVLFLSAFVSGSGGPG